MGLRGVEGRDKSDEGLAALAAELKVRWIGKRALRAYPLQFIPALAAESYSVGILSVALWAIHQTIPPFERELVELSGQPMSACMRNDSIEVLRTKQESCI